MDLPSDWIVGEGAKSPLLEASSRLWYRSSGQTLSEDAAHRSEGVGRVVATIGAIRASYSFALMQIYFVLEHIHPSLIWQDS